jgi:hypothetical protein
VKYYMIKVEAGGKWHHFGVVSHNALIAVSDVAMAGVPDEAHIGVRLAKAGENLPPVTMERIAELAQLGWTRTLPSVSVTP